MVQNRVKKKARRKEGVCTNCGRRFIPKRRNQEFCNRLCEEESEQTELEDCLFLLDEI